MARKSSVVSDTVTVTSNGRTVVDARRLFAKKHIQNAFHEMRTKWLATRRKNAAKKEEASDQ